MKQMEVDEKLNLIAPERRLKIEAHCPKGVKIKQVGATCPNESRFVAIRSLPCLSKRKT
jgi:hypothetical protein